MTRLLTLERFAELRDGEGDLQVGPHPAGLKTDGNVSKNTLAFTVKIGDQTEALTGEIAGDAIELWLDRQGRTNAVVLKRAKK
jgi:hypothetical protein